MRSRSGLALGVARLLFVLVRFVRRPSPSRDKTYRGTIICIHRATMNCKRFQSRYDRRDRLEGVERRRLRRLRNRVVSFSPRAERRVNRSMESRPTTARAIPKTTAGAMREGEFVIDSISQTHKSTFASNKHPTDEELMALASFRSALRRFLAFSEQAAADLGLTMQWYQALLVVKAHRGGDHISVGELAEQLMIRDHSAAELVSRLVHAKLVKRKTDPSDRRRSLIIMTPSGDRCLTQLAQVHLERLRENKEAFLNLFNVADE
jgi:DNA-binding MarR family transcriptional regulator